MDPVGRPACPAPSQHQVTVDPGEYFSLDGRIVRTRFAIFYGLPLLLLGALPGLLLPHGPTQVSLESAVCLLVLPGICRRLHDINRSLWTFLFVEAAYFGVLVIQRTGVFGGWQTVAILLANVPLLVLLVVLLVAPGTPGPNRFGLDPSSPS